MTPNLEAVVLSQSAARPHNRRRRAPGGDAAALPPRCACGETDPQAFFPSLRYRCKSCHAKAARQHYATPEGRKANLARQERYRDRRRGQRQSKEADALPEVAPAPWSRSGVPATVRTPELLTVPPCAACDPGCHGVLTWWCGTCARWESCDDRCGGGLRAPGLGEGTHPTRSWEAMR
jgi:hypothetical protein